MPQILSIDRFLAYGHPLIDVRSPAEFAHGHIPGAQSMPLFTDEERAQVGTAYRQVGRDTAVLKGLNIVGPRLATLVEQARAIAPDGKVGIHCWRGGERSASVSWLLEKAGFAEVVTLERGYKAFRGHVINSFTRPFIMRVIGGYTGSGKTELLHHLREIGEQVVDLEGLACHKGSAYGGIGQTPQPSTEQFENLLWGELDKLEPHRPLWIEDESLQIGRIHIPDAFFACMRSAPVVFIDRPVEERVERLVLEYGNLSKEMLAAATLRIERRLGPQHTKAALEALDQGDLHTVARLTLRYYDKAYLRGLELRSDVSVRKLHLEKAISTDTAIQLKEHAYGPAT